MSTGKHKKQDVNYTNKTWYVIEYLMYRNCYFMHVDKRCLSYASNAVIIPYST